MNRWFVLLAFLSLWGCEKLSKENAGPSAPAAPAPVAAPMAPQAEPSAPAATAPSSQVLARINGTDITDAEVSERVQNRLRKLDSQIFDIKMDGLTDLIEEKILEMEAQKRKVSVDDLLKTEVANRVEKPAEQEIEAFYKMSKARFGDQPFAKVKDQIARQLKSTKERALYEKFIAGLRKQGKIELLIQRPRIEVSADDDPSKGDANAPITLIEFSDFQCPFCKRVQPTMQKIMEEYGKKVRRVFRDFPLSFHKQAPKASQAANCAHDQGKYWEYNASLWEHQQAIQIEDLKKYAKDLGLDEKKFSECLDSDKYAAEIEKDINDGIAAGVSGTPAYFVNGVFISGAQPFERFQEIIDEELTRLGK